MSESQITIKPANSWAATATAELRSGRSIDAGPQFPAARRYLETRRRFPVSLLFPKKTVMTPPTTSEAIRWRASIILTLASSANAFVTAMKSRILPPMRAPLDVQCVLVSRHIRKRCQGLTGRSDTTALMLTASTMASSASSPIATARPPSVIVLIGVSKHLQDGPKFAATPRTPRSIGQLRTGYCFVTQSICNTSWILIFAENASITWVRNRQARNRPVHSPYWPVAGP